MKLKILRSLVVILVCVSAALVITTARAQKSAATAEPLALTAAELPAASQTPASAQTPATAAAPKEKTLGQSTEVKNIQVLKDLPESQLGTVMNFMASSLGRRCDYCHVNKGGVWTWESDEKPEKQTGRAMIKMVMEINKSNFKGNTAVSCYTCHRGRTSPMGIPTLPLPTPSPRPQPAAAAPGTPAAGSQATPAPTPALPTPDQILAKYTEALGGSAAIDKMQSRIMKGTFTGANGTPIPFEAYQKAPDKFYLNVSTPQGTVERAFDGKVAWDKGPRGVNPLENPLLDSLKSVFLMFHNIKLKEQFAQMRLGGKDMIGDREVIVISGRTTDGHRARLFFDAQTGLLVRRISYTETLVGVIPEQIDFDDYRVVDGVEVPFMVRVSSVEPGLLSTRKFEEIKINVPVEDTKFSMPPKP